MMRKYPVRFGGGPMEKGQQCYLASGLPYFLTLGDEAHERDLPSRSASAGAGLLEHLRRFLLEMGAGFAFVGSQHHLQVGDSDFYLDLLFYHTRLHCYVVVDLKMGKFAPADPPGLPVQRRAAQLLSLRRRRPAADRR